MVRMGLAINEDNNEEAIGKINQETKTERVI